MRPLLPLIALCVVAIAIAVTVLMWSRYADPEWVGRVDLQTASVVGRVLDGQGKPMPNVDLVWFGKAEVESKGMNSVFQERGRTTSGADGGFCFAAVGAGSGYIATAGSSRCEGRTGEFSPRNGFEARLDVIVKAVSPRRVVRGKLLNADGTPASPRLVKGRASSWFTAWQGAAESRLDGSFEVLLPWECDEVELTWQPFDGSAPPSAAVMVRPGQDLELRVADGK